MRSYITCTMSFKKIFFSYSRVDGSDFALKLARDLKQKGFDVWIDQEDIRAGSEWDVEIEHALETCDCLLFLESEKSVASNNVLDEVYYALEQKKRVIPIIIHDSKTPYRLQRLQHIDFSVDYNRGLADLVSELEEAGGNMSWSAEGIAGNSSVSSSSKKLVPVVIAVLLLAIAGAGYYFIGNKKSVATPGTEQESSLAAANVTGSWQLESVTPAATLGEGYLKIEATETNKLNIRSAFQFYYPQTNDTLFLQVFNGLAGCKNCEMHRNMKLETEDAAIGSQQYTVAKKQIAGKEVRDTLASRGSNQSIRATCTLQFTDDNNAVIKVQSTETIKLNSGIVLEPFVYTFGFTKT